MRSASSVVALSRRDRVLISTCLVLITALAWGYLVRLDRQMSSSLTHGAMMAQMGMTTDMAWTATDVFFTFAMWTVMMVGMMLGPASPVLLLFAGMHAGRTKRGVPLAVLVFGLGYVTVWVGFSACAALGQWVLHQTAVLSPVMAASNPILGGAILVAAGAYQLTPLKGTCLMHCRSPLGFLMTNWRDGTIGAFQMGLLHGVYCLGCCWALMCVLFVVGVMNLVWVAALAVFVLVEKIAPAGGILARLAGALMIAFGVLFLAGVR
jgi:predicted metal-binding membrane protein